MYNKRHVLILFIMIIALIYIYGIAHGYYYNMLIDSSPIIELYKGQFKDTNNSSLTIDNRALIDGESKTKRYKYMLSYDEFKIFDGISGDIHSDFYIMVEKPDCQYIEVYINDILLGRVGDLAGDSNLWNGTLFFEFNDTNLKEENKLEIRMISDYMTGVGGNIRILQYEEYRKINIMTSISYGLINGASVITIFVSFLLLLIMIAWRKQIYKIHVYGYFLISIFFLGVGLLDYRELHFIFVSYTIFKYVVILGFHISITFATLAVTHLLNVKNKFNIGMLSTLLILIAIVTSENLIEFRTAYSYINYFLVLTGLQMIYLLIRHRRRAPLTASVMLYGFTLCLISVIRLVMITMNNYRGTTLIDLPLLVLVYIVMIMFVVYLELLQIVGDYGFMTDEGAREKTNKQQGYFIIGKSYKVIGVYSTSCDHIFGKRITGLHINQFLFKDYVESEYDFISDTLSEVFNPDVDFKDGFIALLPEKIEIGNEIYDLSYLPVDKGDVFLRITLTNITKNVELVQELNEQKKFYEFIINAVKSAQETNYFIEKTKEFIDSLRREGFTEKNIMALHTFKGNLGQLGFYAFEKDVHDIENKIESGNYNSDKLIDSLEMNFYESLDILNDYIGEDYFEVGYNQVVVSMEDLIALENTYSSKTKKEHFNMDFFNHLKAMKYVNFTDMLKRYEEYLPRIAMENEKGLMPFSVHGEDIRVLGAKAEDLIRVLVAIFRNAIVHGIETPEERMLSGKDSFGTISCETKLVDDNIIIDIIDDGKGVDVEKVMNRAVSNNIISNEDSITMTEQEKIMLIFKANMSQKEDVDLYAGRGIGLSAVYLTVLDLHGTIDVETAKGQGTKMHIAVPISNLIDQ